MASSSDHLKMIQDFPVYPTLRQISLMADQCGVSDLIAAKKLVHLALATLGAISLPVSVAERLPGPGDCDGEGRCWWGRPESDDWSADWTLATQEAVDTFCTFSPRVYWLPATALPIPAGEVQP